MQRIVLSRTDRIGDLVLSTPAIATVRASFPESHIVMVVSRYNRIVVERNPDIDELVVADAGKAKAMPALRDADLAIALAPRRSDLQIVGTTRAAVRVGYTYERRWIARLTASLYVNRLMISEADPELCERDPSRVVRHEVFQLLDLVAMAGARQRIESLRLDLIDEDRSVARRLPVRPIVMHLGSRWFSDGSTLEAALAIVERLSSISPVVVTCATECDHLAPAFERSGTTAAVLRGLPFHQWAAVLEAASAVVTVDTGATHVASAVRRPTVVAFEHRFFRLNSQEWAPYGVPHALVRKPANDDDASLRNFIDDVVSGVGRLLR